MNSLEYQSDRVLPGFSLLYTISEKYSHHFKGLVRKRIPPPINSINTIPNQEPSVLTDASS
jgi:hypothetical protein